MSEPPQQSKPGDEMSPQSPSEPQSSLNWSDSDNRAPMALPGKPLIRYVGDYELIEEIARGGMGIVYKARQRSLNRIVAVKMILSGQLASELEVKRFRTEAEAVANLHHPNIVTIFEVGEHEGQQYLSMDYVAGQSLAVRLKSGRIPVHVAVELVCKVARAVFYAHQRGIIHRDLKPSNILLDTTGNPKVTDFGLAKRMDNTDDLTLSGAVLGTPSYMAPEQALGKTSQLTTAVDVHSLGAILYHLLTGQPPYAEHTTLATLKAVVEKMPTSPRMLNSAIDLDLATICLKCLEKEPERRYSSAEALAEDLERWHKHEPIQARPVTAWERGQMWVKRQPMLATFATLLVLALVGCGILGLWALRQSKIAKMEILRANVFENNMEQRQWRETSLQKDPVSRAQDPILRSDRSVLVLQSIKDAASKKQVQPIPKSVQGYVRTALETYSARTVNFKAQSFQNFDQMLKNTPDDRLAAAMLYRTMQHRLKCIPVSPCMAHSRNIVQCGFSPDNRWLLTRTDDDMVRVWDADTGTSVFDVLLDDPSVQIQFSLNSCLLLVIKNNLCEAVWEIASRTKLNGKKVTPDLLNLHRQINLKTNKNISETTALSPDGSWMALATKRFGVMIYNVETGDRVCEIPQAYGLREGGSISDDSRWLYTVGPQNVQVYDVNLRRNLLDTIVFGGDLTQIYFSPDGSRLAMQVNTLKFVDNRIKNVVSVWRLAIDNPEFSSMVHSSKVTWAEFSPDGRLVTACTNGTAQVWDFNTFKTLSPPVRHEKSVGQARFSPDGRWFATASHDGTARVWNTTNGSLRTKPMNMGGRITSLFFSPNNRWIALASDNGTAQVWNAETGEPVSSTLRHQAAINDIHFSPNGQWVITGSSDYTACVWEAATGQLRGPPIALEWRVNSVRFSPDNHNVFISGVSPVDSFSRSVQVWDFETARLKCEFDSPSESLLSASFAEITPDGNLVTAISEKNLYVKGWNDARTIFKTYVDSGVKSARFSSDGQWIAYTDKASVFVFPTTNSWKNSICLKHPSPVLGAVFSPDSRWLVTVADDNGVRAWELCPGKPGASYAHLPKIVKAVTSMLERDDSGGFVYQAPAAKLQKLKHEYRDNPDAVRIIEWYLDSSTNRTISPFSPVRINSVNQ